MNQLGSKRIERLEEKMERLENKMDEMMELLKILVKDKISENK